MHQAEEGLSVPFQMLFLHPYYLNDLSSKAMSMKKILLMLLVCSVSVVVAPPKPKNVAPAKPKKSDLLEIARTNFDALLASSDEMLAREKIGLKLSEEELALGEARCMELEASFKGLRGQTKFMQQARLLIGVIRSALAGARLAREKQLESERVLAREKANFAACDAFPASRAAESLNRLLAQISPARSFLPGEGERRAMDAAREELGDPRILDRLHWVNLSADCLRAHLSFILAKGTFAACVDLFFCEKSKEAFPCSPEDKVKRLVLRYWILGLIFPSMGEDGFANAFNKDAYEYFVTKLGKESLADRLPVSCYDQLFDALDLNSAELELGEGDVLHCAYSSCPKIAWTKDSAGEDKKYCSQRCFSLDKIMPAMEGKGSTLVYSFVRGFDGTDVKRFHAEIFVPKPTARADASRFEEGKAAGDEAL